MPLINTSVPNLIQGVSQQPDPSRYDGQCEEQENALSSVVAGLSKRPNTRHVASLLTEAIDSDSFIHFIDRDANEKYVVIHDGSKVQAWNITDGTEATINGSTGGYTTSGTYLDSSTPFSELKALTISDNTFILNTETTVQKDVTLSEPVTNKALCYIKQADYKKSYQVSAGGVIPAQFTVARTGTTENYTYTFTVTDGGSGYEDNDNDEIFAYPLGLFSGDPDQFAVGYNTSAVVSNGQITSIPTLTGVSADFGEAWALTEPEGFKGSIGVKTSSSSDAGTLDTSAMVGFMAFGTGSGYSNASGMSSAARTEFQYNHGMVQNGHVLTITPLTDGLASNPYEVGETMFLEAKDGLSGEGLGLNYLSVDAITDLPAQAPNNYKIKVVGDSELAQDDYYVKFETQDGSSFGNGAYVETDGDAILNAIDASTFPMRLISTGVNTFTLGVIDLTNRAAGDDDSNPFPSFVDNKIKGMFFYKNRLGFLSNENVTLSESGEFFNFFRTSVRSLLDSDRIDVSVSSTRVTNLKSAVGFQENLIMFSDNSQFVLKGGDLLTPKTVSITPVTNFDVDTTVDPLALGSYLYFPFTSGNFTGIREYTVNATTDNYDSSDVTEHVPNYVPKNIQAIAGTTTENILAIVSSDDPSTLYIYKYFWSGAKKLLSAWSKFTFSGQIRGLEFFNDVLYMVTTLNNKTHLVTLPFEGATTDDAGFLTHLDMRVSRTVSAETDSITIPYNVEQDDNLQVWTKDGAFLESSSHLNSVQLAQPVDEDTEVWVGIPYTMKYTFSEQIFKAAAGQGKSPSDIGKLIIRNMNLFFDETAAFKVNITPKFRDTVTAVFTPTVVGSSTIGTLTLEDGAFRVPVFTKAEDTTITIESDSALPCSFQSAEFESFVHSRSNRIT